MKKSALGTILVVALVLIAGTAMAHRYGGGMMNGYGMMNDDADSGYGFCYRYDDVDRKEVRAITGKYADQFDALGQKMDAKRGEIRKARNNDATTLGQLNKLRDEMFSIRKDYRDLRAKVDSELAAKFGEPDNDHYDGRMGPGMMGGRHHRGMMDGDGYYGGGCRW